jgi:hypothetical protein
MQISCPQCGKMLEAPFPLPERAQCPFCNAVFAPTLPTPRTPDVPPPPPGQTVWPSTVPAASFPTPNVTARAAEQLRVPALGVLIAGMLSLLLALGDLLLAIAMLMGFQLGPPPQNLPPILQGLFQPTPGQVAFGAVLNGIRVVTCSLVIYGGLKMQRLESYGWAVTSSILSLIFCLNCCCCLGIPFGIWALVVLNRPEVRAAFR